MDRVILHCDMNSFFASVELLDHPELCAKPVAVCGDPDSRHGIILAKNEGAKKYGIKTAETIWQARKKCPQLVLLPPHMDKYRAFSRELNKIYQRYTDLVEPFSIDESWLDVTASTDLFGSGRHVADEIRHTVKRELGLTLSAGVSFNKTFAKMGSEYRKPDATTEITRENYKELLWPLDAGEMFFVGNASAKKLGSIGIKTIGDIALSTPEALSALLGKAGRSLWEHANGIDDSPVMHFSHREKIKSVGNGITFKRNLTSEEDIKIALTALSDTVCSRLRKYAMKASGIKIDIKDPDFRVISRQKQLFAPTNVSSDFVKASLEIMHSVWKEGQPIRLITVTGIYLVDEDEDIQMSLFGNNEEAQKKSESLARAMDSVREKYGSSSIGFAAVLDNDIGIAVGNSPHENKPE